MIAVAEFKKVFYCRPLPFIKGVRESALIGEDDLWFILTMEEGKTELLVLTVERVGFRLGVIARHQIAPLKHPQCSGYK
mgnify:CR=1 FL=1